VDIKNSFLLKIGTEARKSRVSYWNDTETISIRFTETPDWLDAGLWFRTSGCAYDAHGGCVMCDYSNGPATTSEQMISYINHGLCQIPINCRVLLVSPSGSMLDENEVPRRALEGILHSIKNSPFEKIVFETRADTITYDAIALCKSLLGERFYGLYAGLESASPFILKYCINKQLKLETVENAIKLCNDNGLQIIFNVLVGVPFLSTRDSINSAVKTVRWAIGKGASRCDLFPIHVKQSTPLAELYEQGLYSPPSLWDLVEVLNVLGESTWSKVGLSWYTTNGAYNIIKSPTTCPVCYNKVVKCLDGFARAHTASFVNSVNGIECDCKKNREETGESLLLPDRVLLGYASLANKFLGADWWGINRNTIRDIVVSDWDNGGGLYVV
jgi:radical SAM enzyme (TIGR01210 family)